MQTLSLFSTPLLVNKQAPTFKAVAASEAGITPLFVPRLLQDTLSFSATPKIRSGTAVAPLHPEGELSAEEKALIELIINPLLRRSKNQGTNLSKDHWVQQLTSLSSSATSHHPSYSNVELLKLHLPKAYRTTEPFTTIAEDHLALKPYQEALQEAKNRMPEMPSADLLAVLPDKAEKKLSALRNPQQFKLNDVLDLLYYRGIPGDVPQQFRGKRRDYANLFEAYQKAIDIAERNILRQKVIQQHLDDLRTFRETAKNLGLLSKFNRAFKQSVAQQGKKILPFSTQPPQQDRQYEKLLRAVFADDKQLPQCYPLTTDQRWLYNMLLDLFSVDREKKVKKVLGLLETKPEAVVTVIEELRRAKP